MNIKKAGTLNVKAPLFYSETDICSFIEKHKDWVERANEKIFNLEKKLENNNNQLVILGRKISDDNNEYIKFEKKFKKEAEKFLAEKLNLLSVELNLKFTKIRFNNSKRIWGQCSQSKIITLNRKLYHLEEALINYVIIHELSHTKHMNHSKKFWNLVTEHCSDYKIIKKQLKEAAYFLYMQY